MALSFVGHGDEYYETIDKINSILRTHMEPTNSNRPKDDAHQFRSSFLSFFEDFWGKEEALVALEGLTRALQKTCMSYEAVLKMVRDDLDARVWGLDEKRKEEFLRETTADIVYKLRCGAHGSALLKLDRVEKPNSAVRLSRNLQQRAILIPFDCLPFGLDENL